MFGLSFFSMIHGCDHARPCVDGTTCVTCTLMRISSGCIHTCHTNGNFPGKLGTVESPSCAPCHIASGAQVHARVQRRRLDDPVARALHVMSSARWAQLRHAATCIDHMCVTMCRVNTVITNEFLEPRARRQNFGMWNFQQLPVYSFQADGVSYSNLGHWHMLRYIVVRCWGWSHRRRRYPSFYHDVQTHFVG